MELIELSSHSLNWKCQVGGGPSAVPRILGWSCVHQLPEGTSMLTGSAELLFWPLGRANLLRSLDSAGHEDALLVVMCRRACFVRWSLRMKRRSHMLQANFFSPVCVRRWRESSSERANFLSQPSQ